MDDRYPVAIGYPDEHRPDGMTALRLTGRLSQEHYRQWCRVMDAGSARDVRKFEEQRDAMALPPVGVISALVDVMIMQQPDDVEPLVNVGRCSSGTIYHLIEYMTHWCAVEDELEAEQDGAM